MITKNTEQLQSSTQISQSETPSVNLTDNFQDRIHDPNFNPFFYPENGVFNPDNPTTEEFAIVRHIATGEEVIMENDLPIIKDDIIISGYDLLKNAADSIPHLWYPYFPSIGIVGITGTSEAGKSSLSRQLALAVCNGDKDFLGKPLNTIHKRVIYISTEDSEVSMKVLLKRQAGDAYIEASKMLRLGFNVTKVFPLLARELKKQRTDLVVIDVWSDLYGDNPNDFAKVRANLNEFTKLANTFKTCICIVHHNTKHSKDAEPSKTNLNGSQAIEAKLRTLLELRAISDDAKQLTVLKGNYISPALKKKRLILTQGNDFNLSFLEEIDSSDESPRRKPKSEDDEVKEKAIQLYTIKGYSQSKVRKLLAEEFGDRAPSHGTLNTILKGFKKGQSKKD